MNSNKENLVNNVLTHQAPSDRALGDGVSPLKPSRKKPRHSNSNQARGTEPASSFKEQPSFSTQAHTTSQLQQGGACAGLQSPCLNMSSSLKQQYSSCDLPRIIFLKLHDLCPAGSAGPEASESTDSDGPDITSPNSRAQLDLWISELEAQNQASSAPESHEAQHPTSNTQSGVHMPDHPGMGTHAGQPICASSGFSGVRDSAAQQPQSHNTCATTMPLPATSTLQSAQETAWMPEPHAGVVRPSENNSSWNPALPGDTRSQQAQASDPAAMQPRTQHQPFLPTAFEVRMMHAQVSQKCQPFVSSHPGLTQDQPVRYLQLGKHSAPGSGHTFTRQSLPNPQQSAYGSAQVRPTPGCFNPQRPQRPLASHPIAIPSASAQLSHPEAIHGQHLSGASQPADSQGPHTQGHAQPGSAHPVSAQQQRHIPGRLSGQSSWPPTNLQGIPGSTRPHASNGSNSAPPSSALPAYHSNLVTHASPAGLPVPASSCPVSHASHVSTAACSSAPAQVPPVPPDAPAHAAPDAHRASSGPCDAGDTSQNPAQAPTQPPHASEQAAQAAANAPAQPARPIAAPRPSFNALQRFQIGKQVASTAPLGSQGMTLERLIQLLQEGSPLNPRLVRLLHDCRSVFAGLVRMRSARQQDTCSLPDDLEVSPMPAFVIGH